MTDRAGRQPASAGPARTRVADAVARTFHGLGRRGLACGLPLALVFPLAAADPVADMNPASAPLPRTERLSDRLGTLLTDEDGEHLGLSWRVPGEQPAQHDLRLRLLSSIDALPRPADQVQAAARERLQRWLAALPVTGRVPLDRTERRWLQAHPEHDPVLRRGHEVVAPPRPTRVHVIADDATQCVLPHVPGAHARDYLDACGPVRVRSVDTVWIVQPDGRVMRTGTGIWNASVRDEPAPGARLWAPARQGDWPENVSLDLARFLATQGPAPDDAAALPGALPVAAPIAMPHPSPAPRDLPVYASDWGGVGLLQTPTARMAPPGSLGITFSHTQPYTRGTVMLQPLSWLEGGFRYTDINNRPYGPESFSGRQTFKDKSIDAKVRLLDEHRWQPALAVGLRDLGGTGLFSGEFVVASKRTGDFDWSLGIGWGYVGARGNLRNPLGALNSRFDTRPSTYDTPTGGTLGAGSWFRGRAASFGGVQYHTPLEQVVLALEFDGNNYRHEPLDNPQPSHSPFNIGVKWRATSWAELAFGLERGHAAMVSLTLRSQIGEQATPKVADRPAPPVRPLPPPAQEPAPARSRPSASVPPVPTTRTTESLDTPPADAADLGLRAEIRLLTDWTVTTIERGDDQWRITVTDPRALLARARIERIAAVLHRDAPATVRRFAIRHVSRGLPVVEHTLDREAWVRERTEPVPPSERQPVITSAGFASFGPGAGADDATATVPRSPRWNGSLGPYLVETLGGPEGFFLYQVGAEARGEWKPRDDAWMSAVARLRLADNYENFDYSGPGALPRVRTFMREYLTTSNLTLPVLQGTTVGRLGDDVFWSLYGGLLESMFAGVGAEMLHRPAGSRFAFGVDVNRVRQRGFGQDFTMRDYSVTTGHATMTWDTGWQDLVGSFAVGRYLAGDVGATLALSRVFRNGVLFGAWATRTNVSAAEFGEGSFDKGIFVRIPFDVILAKSTSGSATIAWAPLTRDGGARLARRFPLIGLTEARDSRVLWYGTGKPR